MRSSSNADRQERRDPHVGRGRMEQGTADTLCRSLPPSSGTRLRPKGPSGCPTDQHDHVSYGRTGASSPGPPSGTSAPHALPRARLAPARRVTMTALEGRLVEGVLRHLLGPIPVPLLARDPPGSLVRRPPVHLGPPAPQRIRSLLVHLAAARPGQASMSASGTRRVPPRAPEPGASSCGRARGARALLTTSKEAGHMPARSPAQRFQVRPRQSLRRAKPRRIAGSPPSWRDPMAQEPDHNSAVPCRPARRSGAQR
jgi:hypothetical protein